MPTTVLTDLYEGVLPELPKAPKGLVLFLFSWSNARVVVVSYVKEGLEKARHLLDDISNQEKTFTVSVLGYDEEAP